MEVNKMKKILLAIGFLGVIGITCVAYAGQMHRSQEFCNSKNCIQTSPYEYNPYECNTEECPRTEQYIYDMCNPNTYVRQENCYNTVETRNHHGRRGNHHSF